MEDTRCKGCGAVLTLSASGREMVCDFCGSTYNIEKDNTVVAKEVTDAQVFELLAASKEADNLAGELKILTKAIELAPDSADAWLRLGIAYGRGGICDKAMECYHKTISINPNEGHAYCNIGAAYLRQGDYAQACQYYESGMALINKDTDAGYPIQLGNYAWAVGKNGDKKRATELINEAEKLGYENAKIVKKNLGISFFGSLFKR